MRVLLIAAALAAVAFFVGSPARGAEGIGVYAEPNIGFSKITFKALEIEKAFLTKTKPEDTDIEDDWENIDPGDVQASVGRKAYYKGSAFSLGGSLGLRLFSLYLGVAYAWDSVTLDGYSKRYRYDPEKLRASGRKFLDTGVVDFHRVMVHIRYGLPVWRFELDFQTRIGALYLGQGPLVMGRAVDGNSGFSGDVGAGIQFAVTKWLGIGMLGYYGFYSFSGTYEGAYGTIGGMNWFVTLHL